VAAQRWQIEPLGQRAPRPVTTDRRPSGVFRASWDDTLRLLLDETGQLGRTGPVVLQLDADRSDIRVDGMLRARAHVEHPGVVVSFTSRFGPLTYATDAYEQRWSGDLTGWQANVRAVALSLTALRAVDRYGVSRTGEQYTGWRALPAGTGAQPVGGVTADQALAMLRHHAGITDPAVLADLEPAALLRMARLRTHPDRGGTRPDWDAVDTAARALRLTTAGAVARG
jgi:hypothetical protein